jgi:anti-repressor protein
MELIKIKEEGGKQLVSAKEMYLGLGLDTSHWSRWAKQNILENPFAIENEDFTPLAMMANGNETKDFVLTLDLAKKIAMTVKNEKGESIRNYFLECEKKLAGKQIPQTYAQALLEAGRLALELEEKNAQLQIMQPKADFFDAVTDSKDAIEIGKVAKVIDLGMGRNQLFEFLRSRNILMRNNIPYQRYIDQELFRVIEQKYQKPDGSTCIGIKTLVFQKGVDYIIKIVKELNNSK